MSSTNILFDSDRWEITAEESKIEDYLGRKSLFLKDGLAVVKDSEFTDGVIEFDVALSQQRGFTGAVWRLQDLRNYEVFYMRSHQSGNPDATQYMPIFNDLHSWQLYHEKGYTAAVKYTFDQWTHVKIVVLEKNAEVYIQDMENPALVIPELKHDIQPGKVGLWALFSGHFANFSYKTKTEITDLSLKGEVSPFGEVKSQKSKVKQPEEAGSGTILSWWISNTFDSKSLDGKFHLTEFDKQQLTWHKSPEISEPSGLVNLARVQGIEEGKDCAFARTTIISEKKQIKKLKFGFSDIVKVYFNDQLLYGGSDAFLSRDYRFLGSIGFFDELYLSLTEGENELWMAVSESFEGPGGWGLQAKFESKEGISFK